jgi:tetratricopeptide (TPR) repeat protein
MSLTKQDASRLSRRALLKSLTWAPLLLRPSPLFGNSWAFAPHPEPGFVFADLRLTPHYPARSPLEDVLRLVQPGSDEYQTEKYAFEIEVPLSRWSDALKSGDLAPIAASLDPGFEGSSLMILEQTKLRSGFGIESVRRKFSADISPGSKQFLAALAGWLGSNAHVASAEFEITSIEALDDHARLTIRYDIVLTTMPSQREERVGLWQTAWRRDASEAWTIVRLAAETETVSVVDGPGFLDVTRKALGDAPSYETQILRGSDYWRTVLDSACGIDVYGNNGVAAADFDNDGFDDLYISQPAGLPNRLYRNRGDGTFEDVTEKAGVGVLDNTACALFADLRNCGLQDLVVVCGSGPLLFLNRGDGTFALKHDAFHFAQPPQGSFTHAAIADYDRDGRLDIYFCVYSYYLGLDQYHYPVPYFDARNGPPNFLFHNAGDGSFVDRTEAAGLNAENDRYSFACAWGESVANNRPDLYVVNDFGRNNFYRNNGDGTFTAMSTQSHLQDVGAGMSACWTDYNNDGRPDMYVANMWSAAGQRVSEQSRFHANASADVRALYQRHARGNALYRNQGERAFANISEQAGAEMGRWAWGSDAWDFDNDGYADIYVSNGYISAPGDKASRADLGSFFWRQVVAKSPDDSSPSLAYEHGWNALNELIRSDHSWSGNERNVMFANNRDGTFSEISGAVGLDFTEDGRSFALADIDHDGRLEIILKNRNAPQLRILHNAMKSIGDSIAFRLQGTTSNRDAIGTAVTLKIGELRQTKYLQAGSGFLAQHSKELLFGIGNSPGSIDATIRWPSGITQHYEELPRNSRISLVEGTADFTAKPFATATVYKQQASSTAPESLPDNIETWLLDPLKAPGFSLPDAQGKTISLDSTRGKFALLYFWSAASSLCKHQLDSLQARHAAFTAMQLTVLAINVDQPEATGQARRTFPFPVLSATQEVAGIYNIIYRYLFDRRQDLVIPAFLLLDRAGMIVKVYQGAIDPQRILDDLPRIPTTQAERLRLALPFAGTYYQGGSQRNDFTYGVAMFQHGYLDEAAKSFQQVIAAKPDNAEGYYNLGTLSLRRNDFAEARRYLQRALELRPNYPEALNNLGMMAAQEGNSQEAIANFQQSLQLRPEYAVALINLGNVYRRQKSFDKALACLSRAVSLNPDDPEANYSLGMLYAQQDQLDAASKYLTRAVALRPDYPEALNNLGVLFVRQQNYTKAEQEFNACIAVSPVYDQSYLNLARLYMLRHDKERARQALQQLLHLQPDNFAAKQGLELLESTP